MNTIKAIDTNYKGYRFRSRLEARWAVFFDALGIKWEYEKEGYLLSDETMYLPDFYLPDLHVFVEVKPENVDKAEIDSLMRQFRDNVDAIVLVTGIPNHNGGDCTLYCHDSTDSTGGSSEWEVAFYHNGLYSGNGALEIAIARQIKQNDFNPAIINIDLTCMATAAVAVASRVISYISYLKLHNVMVLCNVILRNPYRHGALNEEEVWEEAEKFITVLGNDSAFQNAISSGGWTVPDCAYSYNGTGTRSRTTMGTYIFLKR